MPPPPALHGWLDANRDISAEHHHHTSGHVGGHCGSVLAAQFMVASRAALGGRAAPSSDARVRCAGARSPSPSHSSGTAIWGARSMLAVQVAACPPGRAASRWGAGSCATASAAGGICNWDESNQNCASAEIDWARHVATPAFVLRPALSSVRVSDRANILGAYVDAQSQRRSRSGQGLHTSPCMENA